MIKILLLGFIISISPEVNLHKNILPIITDLREVYNDSIHITSNLRNPLENKKINGVHNSKHLCGKAIDIRVRGLSRENVLDILKLKEYNYNIVIESDHIHIETKEDCNV